MAEQGTVPERLWNKNFILICLTNLALFTSFYFLLPTLPVLVTDHLGGDQQAVGYAMGLLSLTAVMVRGSAGYFLDTLGRRKILQVALGYIVISMALYSLVGSMMTLLALRALHGIGWGFTTTAAGTVAADVIPSDRRGEGMGYYGLSNTLAMALGPGLALYLSQRYGMDILFQTGTAVAVVAWATAFWIRYDENMPPPEKAEKSRSFFEPRVIGLAGVMFFIAAAYGGFVSFITLYGREKGLGEIGVIFMIFAGALFCVRPYAGRRFDMDGPRQLGLIGFTSLMGSFLLLAKADSAMIFYLAAFLLGVGYSIVQPIILAMAIQRVEPFRRGAANGTVFTAFDSGMGLGSIGLGAVANSMGFAAMYAMVGGMLLLPALWFYWKEVR